jgi:ligand-binding sensor domain-containing protein
MKLIWLLVGWVVAVSGGARVYAGGPLLSEEAYGKIIKAVVRDRAGNLWFATSWAGVFRYDGKAFTRYSMKDGLASDAVNAIHEDQGGVLWFGTDKGVSRYDGRAFSGFSLQAFGAAAPTITSIVRDKAGALWFGVWGAPGDAGVYRYDGTQVMHLLRDKPIQGIVADDAGGVWLNTFRYDGQVFTDFSGREHAFKEAVFCSLLDRAGNVWFGVRSDGLYRYDGRAFTWFPEKDGTFGRVTGLFQDSAGRIWLGGDIRFGTEKGGLAAYDGKSFVHFPQVHALGMFSVWAIAEDRSGNLWFGGRGGKLLRYDGDSFADLSAELR